MRWASSALIESPTSRTSIALQKGICLGSRTMEPPLGMIARFTSVRPKVACWAAMRMSVAWMISVPPARQ